MSVNFDIRGTMVGVRPPICAICTGGDEPRIVLVQKGKGVRHWPHEGHRTESNKRTVRTENGGDGLVSGEALKHSPTDGGSTPPASTKTCNACNKPFTNRGGVCNRCRQAAYRRRHEKEA